MKRVGFIDLGSNSLRLLVAEESGEILYDLKKVTRLSEGLSRENRIQKEAWERTLIALEQLLEESFIKGSDIKCFICTEALRRAKNSDVLLEELRAKGLNPLLISGEEEAELSFLALSTPGFVPRLLFDLGGGSCEWVYRSSSGALNRMSLPLGSVVATETYLDSDESDPHSPGHLRAAIHEALAPLASVGEEVVGMGGTIVNLARVLMEEEEGGEVDGVWVSLDALRSLRGRLALMRVCEREQLKGLEPARAVHIVGGAYVIVESLEALGAKGCVVSTKGIRHGMLSRWLLGR